MTPDQVKAAVRAIPKDKFFVWDGVNEDDRSLTDAELKSGIEEAKRKRGPRGVRDFVLAHILLRSCFDVGFADGTCKSSTLLLVGLTEQRCRSVVKDANFHDRNCACNNSIKGLL